jgi:hypothetical protein
MKIARYAIACFLLSLGCAYGQMIILSTHPKDPDVEPEQRTATIVHYEKMRSSARVTIRVLALALQNTDGGQKTKLNEAIDTTQDTVDWANWCILALRDKTAEARACVFTPDPK